MTQNTLRYGILLPPFRPIEELQDVSFEVCQGELGAAGYRACLRIAWRERWASRSLVGRKSGSQRTCMGLSLGPSPVAMNSKNI